MTKTSAKPLNYSTTIAPMKTVGEIQVILAKHGAVNVSVDFKDSEPIAVMFSLQVGDLFPAYRLPSNPDGVLLSMRRAGLATRYLTRHHASRVSWRITKDWLEAQLAIIQSQQMTAYQAYLPFMINPQTGQTLSEMIEDKGITALLPGGV